jgi:ABC-2 type transport system ATP-binding protein
MTTNLDDHVVIRTHGLERRFQTYRKQEGLLASVTGFFRRQYEYKQALQPTNLEIKSGSIVGLVGANGAGKTTLLKLLSGLVHPSAGQAFVLGYEPARRQDDFLRQMGILLGQKNQLWWDIPPADSFSLLGRIYGLSDIAVRARVAELAEILKCTDQLHIQLRRLSLGERMKMEVIGALLHRPKILFLDEPTIGLDIVAQSAIRGFLMEYARAERPTIILTSHYMDDITHLADRLLLISSGGIVYDGTVKGFVESADLKQRVRMRFETPLTADVVSEEGLLLIKQGSSVADVSIGEAGVSGMLRSILAQTHIAELQIEQTDFEDVIHEFLAAESGRR